MFRLLTSQINQIRWVVPTKAREAGQTLIETMAALFMLAMGMTAAVGLAIYAFSASDNITKQIVGIGLAREGIEAVKNMRDTNWLRQTTIDLNCYNFETGQSSPNYPDPAGGARCYKNWLSQVYALSPASGNATYRLGFDPASANFWQLTAAANSFGLDSPNFTNPAFIDAAGFNGVYYHPSSPVLHGNSIYYRKIRLIKETPNTAYSQSNYERIKVITQVWWRGKNCPENRSDVSYPSADKCLVTLEMYLTNWKNY